MPIDPINIAQKVIREEANALSNLAETLDQSFIEFTNKLLACQGKIFLSGIGKSGLIAQKICATLSSTGSPSLFLHPGEACHGDLGMLSADDLIILISKSGETDELINLIPYLKTLHVPMCAITCNANSTLANMAMHHLYVPVEEEACPLGLAPTTSTTATLALGDAIAAVLMQAKDFGQAHFAQRHPGGSLGQKLMHTVGDIMRTGQALPLVNKDMLLNDVLCIMSEKHIGCAIVVDDTQTLRGIFTDGDLRRCIQRADVFQQPITSLMTTPCTAITADMMALAALKEMERIKCQALVVINEQNQPIGAITFHDLILSGVSE